MSDPTPPPVPKVSADAVSAWLGEARIKQLDKISNGRFSDHMQTACNAAEDAGQASLDLIHLCSGKVKPEEIRKLKGEPEPALASVPVEPAPEAEAKAPRKRK